MADKRVLSEVRLNQALVTIGSDTAWYNTKVDIEYGYNDVPIKTAESMLVLGRKVGGGFARGTITFVQPTAELLRILADSTSTPYHAKTPGAARTTVAIQIHNVEDGATQTADIFVYAAIWGAVKHTYDGTKLVEIEVPFEGIADANGKTWRVGMTAA